MTASIESLLRSALGLPGDQVVRGMSFEGTQEWDSVAHFELVLLIEQEFGIQLAPSDVVEMTDYAAVCRILATRYGIDAGYPAADGSG